jgi:hypothetical protein
MGVDPSSFSLDKINSMKDLEIARHSLIAKQVNGKSDMEKPESRQPLLLGFDEESEDDFDFTPVISKKTRKNSGETEKERGLCR